MDRKYDTAQSGGKSLEHGVQCNPRQGGGESAAKKGKMGTEPAEKLGNSVTTLGGSRKSGGK